MKKITPIIILLFVLGLVVCILSLAEKGENEQVDILEEKKDENKQREVRPGDPCQILGNCGHRESMDKPIIYIYPKEKLQVEVSYPAHKKFDVCYPEYNSKWSVTAYPDGTLEDKEGKQYYALYWEDVTNTNVKIDKGFVVKGLDTASFLEEKLALLGLNEKEANEFIIYWLPHMQSNNYNLISFKNEALYNEYELNVNPSPDTLIRVYMIYKPLDSYIEVEPEILTPVQRNGYTVVEWGGMEVK